MGNADSGVGCADDVGDGEGETDGEGEAAELYALKAGVSYRAHYVPVEVAASGGEFPDGVGEGLKSPYPLVLGYDVFVEEELSSGAERSAYLAHDEIKVFYHSEGEGGDYAVEGAVGEGQALAYRGNDGSVGAASLGCLDEAADHVGIGLDGYQVYSGWIERDVGAGSAADFECSAEAEAGGDPAVWNDAGFDAGVEEVVEGGEKAFAEFVIFHGGCWSLVISS